ncbi:DNA primase [Patescibacteria group bacterium]|nr:DNA primase [Patescibacteria group bacterium]
MNHLEEIRAKLAIEEVVGGYIQLKKAGRNLKGLCPFHNDSRPSFTVSPEKGIAYCFACNTGGDIFKFIQLIENVEFPEAVRILAQRANVPLPEFKPEAHNKRLQIIEMNRSSAKFFSEQLQDSDKHKKYFLDRGLSEETIQKFKLGYAPDSYHALKDHLEKIGYKENDLINSGLLNQRSIADKNTYDRFRNRYIFPIYDHQDNPVGFGGRIIDEGEPKYLNSPDTPAYNKSLILYGLNFGKNAVKKEDLAVFVEGYMDVIAAHQAGTENVIATSGTALTAPQLKLIKRYTPNVAFAFDQDAAGLEATKRSIELAQEAELNIKIVTVPEGKDPDECIKKSPEKWIEAIKNAVPAMDFYFSYALKQYDKNTLDGKKGILNLILPLIKQHQTEMEQNQYLERLALELKTDIKLLWNDLKNFNIKKTYSQAKQETDQVPVRQIFSREEFLLGFIFHKPDLYNLVQENLIDSIPFDTRTEKFYKACRKVYNRLSTIDLGELKKELEPDDHEKLQIYPLLIEEHYPDFGDDAMEREVINLIRTINKTNLHNVQKEYEFKIRAAKDAGEKTLLLNQYNQILKLSAKIS